MAYLITDDKIKDFCRSYIIDRVDENYRLPLEDRDFFSQVYNAADAEMRKAMDRYVDDAGEEQTNAAVNAINQVCRIAEASVIVTTTKGIAISSMAKQIAEAREKRGISQSELDRLAGLARGHVGKIENLALREISISTVFAIAQALGTRFKIG